MLRPRTQLISLTIVLLLSIGGLFGQEKKSGEVTVTKCWRFPAADVVALATNGTDIFAAADGGRVFALSAKGEKLWQTDLGGDGPSGIEVYGEYVVVSPQGQWLSEKSGLPGEPAGHYVRSELTNVTHKDATAAASFSGGQIIGYDSGLVTWVSDSGPVVWKFKSGGAISAIVTAGDDVVVISRDNFVYSLHSRNGGLNWKKRLQGRVAHYGIVGGYLLVSALDQHGVWLIDLSTGRVAAQIALEGDDQLSADPVSVRNSFTIATDAGITGYSLVGCAEKETTSKP